MILIKKINNNPEHVTNVGTVINGNKWKVVWSLFMKQKIPVNKLFKYVLKF
jgi:hypothetical protein